MVSESSIESLPLAEPDIPETAEQSSAFRRYLKMGSGRSLVRLHEELVEEQGEDAPCLRTIENWSSRLSWRARVREFDRARAEADRERTAREYRDLQERHAAERRVLQVMGIKALKAKPVESLTASEGIRLVKLGVDIEKGSTRRPPERIDITETLRELAIEEGLDPDEAERIARRILRIQERQQRAAG